jgi:excisionase family DNA binding protein
MIDISERPHMMTLPEAAQAFGLPLYAIRRWVKSGELKAVYAGKKAFVNEAILRAFLSGE